MKDEKNDKSFALVEVFAVHPPISRIYKTRWGGVNSSLYKKQDEKLMVRSWFDKW